MIPSHELILYKNFKYNTIFEDITWLFNHYEDDYYNQEDLIALLYENLHKLVELAGEYGFQGNLWHNFLAFLIANNENSFSRACEIRGKIGGTLNTVALHDFRIFRMLFQFDWKCLDQVLHTETVLLMGDFQGCDSKILNRRVRDRINELSINLKKANSEAAFFDIVTDFYREFGVGKFGLHKAFRIQHIENKVAIIPITNIEHIYLKDLVGYDIQKKKLINNTSAFVEGRKANNVLLFGDSGTGKSSSIKAILNEYYDKGLRMIEVFKHQFQDLHALIEQVKDRNYKFIIYMDDLSFEDFEIEYKYLKAIIEGGLEKKPDNVLIYATSNRRHLIREKFSDKEERKDDLHSSDTVQEKLSLVARFGVTIYYGAPAKKEFQTIVKALAERYGIQMDEQTLYLEANRWELSHGGLSGRTAQQFINYLLGSGKLEQK